ncbi:MAG TPA: HAD-IC family P-type ATPase, partial [Candidatus Acidoferrum sp.]|nr:HAD-IC family P-type ATPase [Candidatus Acidoferrum sp.]
MNFVKDTVSAPPHTIFPLQTGLSSPEAAERLGHYGPNDPAASKPRTALTELLLLFVNPLVIILLIASLVSFVLRNTSDALIIAVLVLLGVSINFIQTYKSHNAVEKLREGVTPTATVLRDGTWQEIKRREVVPGDIIRVSAGDLVPADARLVESSHLYVQQAALTGESLPVEKNAGGSEHAVTQGPDAPDLVFMGTSVVSGMGIALILATGPQTAFGAIAERLVTRPQENEFEHSMKRFGFLIMRAIFFLVLFILV